MENALLSILKEELKGIQGLLRWQTVLLTAIAVQLGLSLSGV